MSPSNGDDPDVPDDTPESDDRHRRESAEARRIRKAKSGAERMRKHRAKLKSGGAIEGHFTLDDEELIKRFKKLRRSYGISTKNMAEMLLVKALREFTEL